MKNISIFILLLFLSITLINTTNNAQVLTRDSSKLVQDKNIISPIKVEIVNLPKKNWLETNAAFITGITGIFGVLLGAIIAYCLQKRILKSQLSLQKKNDWTNYFRNIVSEMLSLHFNIFDKLLYDKNYPSSMYNIRPDKLELRKYEDRVNYYKRLLSFYLDEDNSLHKELQNSLDDVYDIYNNITKKKNESYSRENVMGKIDNCLEIGNKIIKANK